MFKVEKSWHIQLLGDHKGLPIIRFESKTILLAKKQFSYDGHPF